VLQIVSSVSKQYRFCLLSGRIKTGAAQFVILFVGDTQVAAVALSTLCTHKQLFIVLRDNRAESRQFTLS
jgi:hypothetical protein